LYCIVLYCIVLYCIVLYCIVLYCIVLYCIVLYCIVLDFCHPQARQIHRCIFAPLTSVNSHYYSVLTTPFDMVNAHYVILDFRANFFIKIQNQASDTSRSLPSVSSAPFLLRAVPSERLGQV
jgi:hypothetical protein